jgi:hypothetical protein
MNEINITWFNDRFDYKLVDFYVLIFKFFFVDNIKWIMKKKVFNK